MAYVVIDDTNSINDTTDNVFLAALIIGPGDHLLVQSDGYVLATGTGSDAVYLTGTNPNGNLTVNGLVFGTQTGIHSLGDSAHLTINGQVLSDGTAMRVANSATVHVSATGLVSGAQEGISLSGSTLVNNGTVHGSGNNAIQLSSGTVINNSLISSDGFASIFFGADSGTGRIHNTGTIIGDLHTWFGASDPASTLTIENSGLWSGRLGLTPGNDTVTNAGEVTESVFLADGDDLLDSRHGLVRGDIDGGAGADTIFAGAGDNTVTGGAGGDTLDGGGGTDTLSYGSSAVGVRVDLINGTASGGDAAGDTFSRFQNVTGTLRTDRLVGDDGDNVLNGVLGNDVVIGNGGNDTLAILGGPGRYTFNGGAGNDVFQLYTAAAATYGRALVAGSRVVGGTGYDTMRLRDTGSVTFTSSTVAQVERIVAENGFDYTLKTHNATVGAGLTLEVDASALTGGKSLNFDGSAETDGAFDIYGGGGMDVLRGGAGADLINGGRHSDTLIGGGGADIFEFGSYLDSSFAHRDSVTGLVAGSDRFQLDVDVTGVDATVSGNVSNAADLQALVSGQLLAQHAILAEVTGGTLSGQTLLVIDANGVAGFQAGADYVVNVSGMTGTLTTSSFLG